MAAPEIICHDSDRESWLAARKVGIGGSDAPQIMGLSSFGGPAKVAATKLGYELGSEDDEPEILRWGRYVEAPMLKALTDETGIEATIDGHLYRSGQPGRDFMLATVDGRCVVDGVEGGIECKLAFWSADAWEEGVPASVDCQVQHNMDVTDLPFFYVLVLLGGYRFRWARVDRRPDWASEVLVPAEADFWQRLQEGRSIAPSGAPDREYEALKARFPDVTPGKVAALTGDDWCRRYDEWRALSATKSDAEKRAKQLRNEFIAAMGDAEYARLDDGQMVSLRSQTRAAHHVKESTFRVLRPYTAK